MERGNACLQAQLPTCIAALLAADLAQAVSVQANDRVLRGRPRDDAGPTFGQSALSRAEPDAATKDKTKEARRKFADNSDCFDLDLCSWVGLPIWNGQKFRAGGVRPVPGVSLVRPRPALARPGMARPLLKKVNVSKSEKK